MDATLLDTDTLNEVLKQKNANAIRHAADYLAQHGQFALHHGRTLVTGNTVHFAWVPGLQILNWRDP